MADYIKQALEDAANTLNTFLTNPQNINVIKEATDEIVRAFNNEGKVYSCGNGGSMCDAMHFA